MIAYFVFAVSAIVAAASPVAPPPLQKGRPPPITTLSLARTAPEFRDGRRNAQFNGMSRSDDEADDHDNGDWTPQTPPESMSKSMTELDRIKAAANKFEDELATDMTFPITKTHRQHPEDYLDYWKINSASFEMSVDRNMAQKLRARHFVREFAKEGNDIWSYNVKRLRMDLEVSPSLPTDPDFVATPEYYGQNYLMNRDAIGVIFLHDIGETFANTRARAFLNELKDNFPGMYVELPSLPNINFKLSAELGVSKPSSKFATGDAPGQTTTKNFFGKFGTRMSSWLNPALFATDDPESVSILGSSTAIDHSCVDRACRAEAAWWSKVEMLNQLRIEAAVRQLHHSSGISMGRIFVAGYGSGALMAERVSVGMAEKREGIGGSIALDPMHGGSMFAFVEAKLNDKQKAHKAGGYRVSWSVGSRGTFSDEQLAKGYNVASQYMDLRWVRLQPIPFRGSKSEQVDLLSGQGGILGFQVRMLRPDTLTVDTGTFTQADGDSDQLWITFTKAGSGGKEDSETIKVHKDWLEGEGGATYTGTIDMTHQKRTRVAINDQVVSLSASHSDRCAHGLGTHDEISEILEGGTRSWLFDDVSAWMHQRLELQARLAAKRMKEMGVRAAKIGIGLASVFLLGHTYIFNYFVNNISKRVS